MLFSGLFSFQPISSESGLRPETLTCLKRLIFISNPYPAKADCDSTNKYTTIFFHNHFQPISSESGLRQGSLITLEYYRIEFPTHIQRKRIATRLGRAGYGQKTDISNPYPAKADCDPSVGTAVQFWITDFQPISSESGLRLVEIKTKSDAPANFQPISSESGLRQKREVRENKAY